MTPIPRLLALLLVLAGCQPGTAPVRPPAATGQPPTAPILRLETGMHTAPIMRIDVDARGRWLLTASTDKTLRLWDLADGALLRSYRPPIEDGNEGKLYAAALSPDGLWVAGAGWTGHEWSRDFSIYLFDRATGQLRQRLPGQGNVIFHLCWSADGRYLGATLGAGQGLRVWAMEGFREVLADRDYGGDSYWCDFAADDRLITSSYDGFLRLYDQDLKRVTKARTPGGGEPFAAVFSPDGRRIAVGFDDSTTVNVLDGHNLSLTYSPNTHGIDNGNLGRVAWSTDGHRLFAGGRYDRADGIGLVLSWDDAGRGSRQAHPVASNTLMDLHPLPDGGLAIGTADPAWVVLDTDGSERLARRPATPDLRKKLGEHFSLSTDATRLRFGLDFGGTQPVLFDLRHPDLNPAPMPDPTLSRPRIDALPITGWEDTTHPRLADRPLPLEDHVRSHSLAIAPDARRFLLGSDWSLLLFDRDGRELWERHVPGTAWGVNISGDGRVAVVAYGDGTLRWHRLDDGEELLALFPHRDGGQWVLWTPDGFFDASPGAEQLIGYHLNRGADQEAEFVGVDQLYDQFYRPDLVAAALGPDYPRLAAEALGAIGDIRQVLAGGLPPTLALEGATRVRSEDGRVSMAVTLSDQRGGIGKLVWRVDGVVQPAARGGIDLSPGHGGRIDRPFELPPGLHQLSVTAYNRAGQVESHAIELEVEVPQRHQRAPRLHVLAAGIDDYLMHDLKLRYAVADAQAIADQLQQHARGLYAPGQVRVLPQQQVTATGLKAAFAEMTADMAPQDLFVFYLAGHGEVRDGRYLFIPQDLEWVNEQALLDGAIDQPALQELLVSVPAQKTLVLLDSCHAGAFGEGQRWASRGAEQRTAIGHLIKATGRAIITASGTEQMALEGEGGHGVFTYALLEGLAGSARGDDRLVSVDELALHIRRRVPEITAARWNYRQFPMYDVQGMDFPLVQTNGE